jgi:putative flavoprotein involved in K+ transport
MQQIRAEAAAHATLTHLGEALARGDHTAAAALFAEDCYWRDLLAFTWTIRTMEGRPAIAAMLEACAARTAPQGWALDPSHPVTETDGIVMAWFRFETAVARGWGAMRLKDGRIWTLATALDALKGHEEPLGTRRPLGTVHRAIKRRETWLERREAEAQRLGHSRQPHVVVVGAGQGGLALGARLRQLGVPTILLEAHDRPGDAWRTRYRSLCLHDPVWYDHMPYLPFPPNWPVYSPKDKLADWLEMYARIFELTVWTRSRCTAARFDEADGRWTVEVDRDGEAVTLRPAELVLATGMSGKPHIPDFPGRDRFRGEQHHSSAHPGPEAWRGKRAVIIGANNSAHDIAQALWEHDARVTMAQRSSTLVVKAETLHDYARKPLYSEEALEAGTDHDKADRILAATPFAIMPALAKPVYDTIRRVDADFYAALEEAGFRLDFGEDGSGLAMKYLRRGSGYYIDVGASQLVIDGEIRLAQGEVREITEDAVVLDSGETLPADLIVHATGFGPMTGWAADLIGPAVAGKVGLVWGLGSGTAKDPGPWEGELRNMWKPTRQRGLWFQGGNLQQARFYSLILALQLKARMEGIATPVYMPGEPADAPRED